MPDQASQLRRLAAGKPTVRPLPSIMVTTPANAQAATMPPMAARAVAGSRASVIAVTSGKGGVGKSNVSVNLATQLASAGKRVLLIDADLGLANADVLCNETLHFNLSHVVAGRKALKDVIVRTAYGFDLLGGASGLSRMADLDEAGRRVLLNALYEAERSVDVVIIDTGAGVNSNVLAFCRSADHVLVVATPEPTSITDAYAMVKTIVGSQGIVSGDVSKDVSKTPARKISILANQVAGETEGRAVYERVARVARQFLGVSVLDAGHVVLDDEMTRAVRRRVPLIKHAPNSPASRCFAQLAKRIEPGLVNENVREPGSVFFRRLIHRMKGNG